jgi:hypothetical protein
MTVALDLAGLEAAVQHALVTSDEAALHVIGYGEIGCVLAWPEPDGPWACKRLPVFDGRDRFEAYRAVFEEYLAALDAHGVGIHDTRLVALPPEHGRLAAYCIQTALPARDLAPALLRDASPERAATLLTEIIGHIADVVTPNVGLDAHLSNWGHDDGRLVYFDVTTPLLRDADGTDRLDTELFLASLPAALRPLVRHFLLGDILDPYFAPRTSALDLLANLHREELGHWVPIGVSLANERLGTDLTVDEVGRHYRQDARLWAILQRLRRLDRAWQRRVRRRPYPLLLPGRITRPRATR